MTDLTAMMGSLGSWRRARAHTAGMVTVAVVLALGLLLPRSQSGFNGQTQNASSVLGAASSFYAETVRRDGATGYWRLGDPAGSAVVADSSGNGRTGIYRNNPRLGVAGTSQDNDTAQEAGSATWGVLPRLVVNDYSVELWFRSTASDPFVATFWGDAPFMMMGNLHYNFTAGNFGIGLNGNGKIMAGTSQTNTTIISPTAYNDGAWHHVVFTRVKSTGAIKLYVDGSLSASATGAGTGTEDDSYNIGLGSNFYRDYEQWRMYDGYLDEVAQYTTALSSTRITAHYNARTSGYTAAVTTDAPAGYWRLNEASGTGRLAATIGGASNAGGIGADVLRGQPGATGDGDTAMRFVRKPPRYAWVPRLISTNFTLEARFRTTRNLGASGTWYGGNDIVSGEQAGKTDDFGFSIGGDGRLYAGTGNPDTTVASPAGTVYNDGTWHTIAMTRSSGGTIRLYADGVLVGSGTGGTQPLTAPPNLQIGSHYWNSNTFEPFDGDISDVAQYSTVLTQTRINAHHAAATSQSAYRNAVQTDSPVGYWPLNDTTGTTLTALVGGAANNGYADNGVQRGIPAPTGSAMRFSLPNEAGAVVPRIVQDTFSLECWFNTSSGFAAPYWYNAAPLIMADAPGTANDFGLSLSPGGSLLYGAVNSAAVITAGAGLNDGQWHHVVVTRNGTSGAVILYLDGAMVVGAAGPTGSLNAASVIGLGYEPNSGRTLEGTIDEVAVYPTVLTATQVAYHHTRGT